jgi:hypothetical protein
LEYTSRLKVEGLSSVHHTPEPVQFEHYATKPFDFELSVEKSGNVLYNTWISSGGNAHYVTQSKEKYEACVSALDAYELPYMCRLVGKFSNGMMDELDVDLLHTPECAHTRMLNKCPSTGYVGFASYHVQVNAAWLDAHKLAVFTKNILGKCTPPR